MNFLVSNVSTLGQSPPPRTAMVCLFISLIMSGVVVQVSCHEYSSHIDFTVFFQVRKNRSNFFDNTRLPYFGISLCPVSCTCVKVAVSGKKCFCDSVSFYTFQSKVKLLKYNLICILLKKKNLAYQTHDFSGLKTGI